MSAAQASQQAKPQRADARRNRDLLLEAAGAVFEERGIEAPLDEIARRAGVGIGTLYRHFPTRDAVVEAVYRREVELLCSGIDDLLAEHDPVTALRTWMRSFAVYVARKRGMATALKAMVGVDSELFRRSHERIEAAITQLVRTAADTGAIRTDLEPMDLLRGMSGICMAGEAHRLSRRSADRRPALRRNRSGRGAGNVGGRQHVRPDPGHRVAGARAAQQAVALEIGDESRPLRRGVTGAHLGPVPACLAHGLPRCVQSASRSAAASCRPSAAACGKRIGAT